MKRRVEDLNGITIVVRKVPIAFARCTSFVRPSRQPSRESKASELFEHRHLFVRRRLSPSEPGDAAVDHPRTAVVPYTP
jgi:hypothetical protein